MRVSCELSYQLSEISGQLLSIESLLQNLISESYFNGYTSTQACFLLLSRIRSQMSNSR